MKHIKTILIFPYLILILSLGYVCGFSKWMYDVTLEAFKDGYKNGKEYL